ncbi:MAG: hypothetical protein P8Y80_07060 [Acidobacteriota bacterium]
MPDRTVELTVCNPRGGLETPAMVSPSPRLRNLDGKKIGVLMFSLWGLAETVFPQLKNALGKRVGRIEFREWSAMVPAESRESRLKEIAEYSDGIIVLLAFTGTSSARTMRDAVYLEKMGKPVAFMVTRPFQANARFIARREGLSDISVVSVPVDSLPLADEIKELKLGEKAADGVIRALTLWSPQPEKKSETSEKTVVFRDKDYETARESVEKYFLRHGWSDGLPLVPPTPYAVNSMLEGLDLSPDHVIGTVEPGGVRATVEDIAINAVMAGCLPQYMPVLTAAIEAITDPAFNLREVQCTSCNMAPLLIVSGPKLVEDLNINCSFGTLGPGWRANTTIGRAVRLIMTNLGRAWPGMNVMKTLGSPFNFSPLIAENEAAFNGAWEPLRVAEGYDFDPPTISVMPAMSWQPDIVQPEPPTVKRIVEYIAKQGKVKHDRLAGNWGMDNLVILCGSTLDCIRREGYSRLDLQKALYDAIQIPSSEFLNGRDISEFSAFGRLPERIKEKCESGPETPVPLLAAPGNIKICVTGGAGPYGISYISTFGYGPARFVTKPVHMPAKWEYLLAECDGWESPTVK